MPFPTAASQLFHRLLSVGADPADSPDLRQRKRIYVVTLWGGIFPNIFFALFFFDVRTPLVASLLAFALLVVLGLLVSLHLRPALFSVGVHILCLFGTLAAFGATLLLGGLVTGAVAVFAGVVFPVFALILLGPSAGIFWTGIYVVAVMVMALISDSVPVRFIVMVPHPSVYMAGVASVVVLFLLFAIMYFIRQRDEFQRKSDDLLRNIFPDEIAERLKNNSAFIADRFDEASVLFADVVAFTPMASQMSPIELVSMLNEVFSEFDQLVEQQGLEKIKTIGDCYMVAAGVPLPRADHAQALSQLALDIQELVASRDFQGRSLRFRIGVNSGSLVAGVIGRRKFIYDLWGDAVNTASRMESHGQGGCIQITEATHALIQADFICEAQGAIDVKGKGEMNVWHVLGKKK